MVVCPISFKQTDAHQARVLAILTATTAALYVATAAPHFLAALFGDFLLRRFIPRYSPGLLLAKLLKSGLRLGELPTDAAAKEFAKVIGLGVTGVALLLHILGLTLAARIAGMALMIFAFMEGALNFCVACHLYPLWLRLRGEL